MINAEFHNTVDDSLLKLTVIPSRHRGKWLFRQHRERDTYECPGGRGEADETIEHTTRRELCERAETACLILTPLSTCLICETLEDTDTPIINYGMLYYGNVTEPGPMPEGYEIARMALFRESPDNWTYPDIQPALLEYLGTRLLESG